MVAARIAFWITRPFISFGYERVRTTKKVIAPMGFTIAKSATKVVIAKLTRSAAMPARTQDGRGTIDRLPRIGDIEDHRVRATLDNPLPAVADLELNDAFQIGCRHVIASPVEELGTDVVGHDPALRPDGMGQGECQGPRAGADLDDEVSRLDVAIP